MVEGRFASRSLTISGPSMSPRGAFGSRRMRAPTIAGMRVAYIQNQITAVHAASATTGASIGLGEGMARLRAGRRSDHSQARRGREGEFRRRGSPAGGFAAYLPEVMVAIGTVEFTTAEGSSA